MSVKRILIEKEVQPLHLSSMVFRANSKLDSRYTCDGINVNPPLTIHHIPFNTETLALLVLDQSTSGREFTHWIVWNIQPDQNLREDHIPGVEGVNDFRQHHYAGPCPDAGTHKYVFKVFALDTWLDLSPHVGRKELEQAIDNHILAQGELAVNYTREEVKA